MTDINLVEECRHGLPPYSCSICARGVRIVRWQSRREARFSGNCDYELCDSGIKRGDWIVAVQTGSMHVECATEWQN
jgi:hypothetical protein